jgi:hypothetical protein
MNEAQSIDKLDPNITTTPVVVHQESNGAVKPPTPLSHQTSQSKQEIPDDPSEATNEASYVIKGSDFKARMDRANKSFLKKLGVESKEELETKLTKYNEMEKQLETQRRATMSEQEKLREDLERERKARTHYQNKLQMERDRAAISKEEKRVYLAASKFINPKLIPAAADKYKKYLKQNYTPKQIDRLTEKNMVEFFNRFVKKNPEFSKDFMKVAKRPQVVPTNGPKVDPPNIQTTSLSNTKTAAPNKPNSLSNQEFKEKFGFMP